MPQHSKIYEEERVLQLLAQDSEYAFTQIFDHYRGTVYTTAVKFLKSPVLAEEIVQDVFLKVWLKRRTMNLIDNFESYLFMMTRNLIFDRLKQVSHDQAMQKEISKSTGSINNTDHLVQDNQYQKILQQAIDLLPPQQKQVYILARVEGLSRQEIALQMNLSPLTVKTHLGKTYQAIRIHLREYLGIVYLPLFLSILSAR